MAESTHTLGGAEQIRIGPAPGPGQAGRVYEWVYLWHWPIRATHWVAATAILVLAATGFYIGQPYFMIQGEPRDAYLMGTIRFIHFVAAGVLVATGIIRVYWLFMGNKFERWPALFPFAPKDWANLWRIVKYYLMIRGEEAPSYMGHNPLQQLAYTGLYAVVAVMIVTGFTLYGQADPGGLIYSLFGWVEGVFGGLQYVRFVHHTLTWVFLVFIPVHVYLTLRVDILENTGTVSSMISGGRFLPKDEEYVDE